ncbi:hypothetical protein T492DRAFT_64118 [Pavlovales sp. CCMP2436]|nr:hypothetical protein T492DRAFT_64118 [Pavlovales sp. CCMP2436]
MCGYLETLLGLCADSVSNVRLAALPALPAIKRRLRVPADVRILEMLKGCVFPPTPPLELSIESSCPAGQRPLVRNRGQGKEITAAPVKRGRLGELRTAHVILILLLVFI